jgi:hypothetical protein
LSLVRFDGNDYSVPVRWAHHPIVAKGYFDRVVLCADGHEVAQYARIWEDEQVCFEPLHYLALLETKPGAFDHARPLAGWTLPECFALLRRRLEAERDCSSEHAGGSGPAGNHIIDTIGNSLCGPASELTLVRSEKCCWVMVACLDVGKNCQQNCQQIDSFGLLTQYPGYRRFLGKLGYRQPKTEPCLTIPTLASM